MSATVLSTDDAKKALLKDQEERQKKCTEELQEILKKHSCSLDVVTVLRNGQHPTHQISIIPK